MLIYMQHINSLHQQHDKQCCTQKTKTGCLQILDVEKKNRKKELLYQKKEFSLIKGIFIELHMMRYVFFMLSYQ